MSTQRIQKLEECLKMLEGYRDRVRKGGLGDIHELNAADMKKWLDDYYPNLSETGFVKDGQFFQSPLKSKNLGIGNDGKFLKYEYAGFLYQGYRILLDQVPPTPGLVSYLRDCIAMLTPYLARFENTSTGTGTAYDLDAADMKCWKEDYYIVLSKIGLVEDADFFNGQPQMGIGNDGRFIGAELLFFLAGCYKLAVETSKKIA